MLASLATFTNKDGSSLGDREMAHIMCVFASRPRLSLTIPDPLSFFRPCRIALLMAGQHTSSATSSWTLLELADRPDIQFVPVSSDSAASSMPL